MSIASDLSPATVRGLEAVLPVCCNGPVPYTPTNSLLVHPQRYLHSGSSPGYAQHLSAWALASPAETLATEERPLHASSSSLLSSEQTS